MWAEAERLVAAFKQQLGAWGGSEGDESRSKGTHGRMRREGSSDVRSVATLRRFPGGLAGYRESSPPVRCEMSWTAALTNPAAFGMSPDEREGAMVYIYEKLAVE